MGRKGSGNGCSKMGNESKVGAVDYMRGVGGLQRRDEISYLVSGELDLLLPL